MKKNYFYNLLLTVFNLLVPVVSFPYVARMLGPEGVGKVQFAMTLSQYVALIAALGIPIYGVREIAKAKYSAQLLSKTFTELIVINFCTSLAFFVIYLCIIFNYPFFRPYGLLFGYSSLLILLSFTSIDWLYAGLEAFKRIALRSIIVKVAALALILIFVNDKADTAIYLFISMFSILANNLINIWFARKMLSPGFKKLHMMRHMRPLVYIFGTTLASTLYTTFDSIILGFISGNRAVGLYTAATKVTKIAIPVIMAYGSVLIPDITNSFQSDNKSRLEAALNKSYAYIVMLAVPISAGLFVFSPALIAIFSGREFMEAAITMRIMSFLPLLIGLGYFWGYQVILPIGRDKFLMFSALAGTAVSLGLNIALVPYVRENGAAIANVCSEVVVTICYYLLIRKFITVPLKHVYIIEALIASTPFLIFLLIKDDYILHNELFSFIVSAVICVFIYCGIQLYGFKNKMMLAIVGKYIGK